MTELATQELARVRAARIRAGIGAYLSTLADVAAAYAQRDWVALGYHSWESYVDGEYSEHRLRLSPEHRAKAVAELRLAGMSQRAIGSALGVSQSTVRDDLAELSTSTQLPERVASLDGRERPATRPTDSGEGDSCVGAASLTSADHPREGEADARLDAARTAASEAPTGAATPVGAGVDLEWPEVRKPVEAALDRYAPDADGPHREWRRNFLAAINGAYRPISRSTVQEVAERADDECVAELVRVAAELSSFADRVRQSRAANRPNNVISLVRPA